MMGNKSTPFRIIKIIVIKRKGKTSWSCENKYFKKRLFSPFPKTLIPSFHMWSQDLPPATVGIYYKGIGAAAAMAHRGHRGASRQRGRASPVRQPAAEERRTRCDGRSFPERQSFLPPSSSSASNRSKTVISRPTDEQTSARTHRRAATYWHQIKNGQACSKSSRIALFARATALRLLRAKKEHFKSILGYLVLLLRRAEISGGKGGGGGGGWMMVRSVE